MSIALAFIPSAVCAVAAFYMATKGIRGWGWFLFVAILLASAASKIGGHV